MRVNLPAVSPATLLSLPLLGCLVGIYSALLSPCNLLPATMLFVPVFPLFSITVVVHAFFMTCHFLFLLHAYVCLVPFTLPAFHTYSTLTDPTASSARLASLLGHLTWHLSAFFLFRLVDWDRTVTDGGIFAGLSLFSSCFSLCPCWHGRRRA